MRRLVPLLALAALAAAPSALAVGPSPGVLLGHGGIVQGSVAYETVASGGGTTLRVLRGDAPVRSVALAGRWGIPLVSYGNDRGGLSHDGSTLVLAEPYMPTGGLRTSSRFLVLPTRSLGRGSVVRLRGDFSFDALSPKGRWLYLTQHVSESDITRYVVRAYDLRTRHLLRRTIADKRQRGWTMAGFPTQRVTSANGRWAYTLYQQNGNFPFVHALDTVSRTAVCIGIPWPWSNTNGVWNTDFTLAGHRLTIATDGRRATIDTRTLRLTR